MQRGKSWEEVFLEVLAGRVGAADRKPLMNSEKRTDVYYSKERMLKESLVCPTLCNLLNLVWAEHL